MEDEYLLWKRFEDITKKILKEAEDQVFMNRKLQLFALQEIKKLERAGKVPKFKKPAKASGVG